MRRRQKFLLSSILLSVGVLTIQWVPLEFRYVGILGFAVITYLVSAYALFDNMKGAEWFTLLVLPTAYSAAIALFYFLLPEGFLTRLLIITPFGVGMYFIYLTENIFSVSAKRTIALLRAAHAAGIFFSVGALVLLYNAIYSLKIDYWMNGLLVFAASFPMLVQSLWSFKLEEKISKQIWGMSLGVALLLGQLAIALSFIPVTVWVAALFLGVMVYVILGLLQHTFEERLFASTIYEYVGIALIVISGTLLITEWK